MPAVKSAVREIDTVIKDSTANPAPLGLMGFGMTTVLLNLHNAGLFELGSMILAMGLCYGGIAQIIAGSMEWKKGNTFGTTAFVSYGLFWLSLVVLLIFPKLGWGRENSAVAMAAYLLMWGMFTFGLFLGTLKMNRAIRIVFGSLTVLFVLLAAADLSAQVWLKRLAGVEGVFCGLSAIYTAIAQILNEVYGKTVMHLGVSRLRRGKKR